MFGPNKVNCVSPCQMCVGVDLTSIVGGGLDAPAPSWALARKTNHYVLTSLITNPPPRCFGSLDDAYDSTLRSLLDKHAPVLTNINAMNVCNVYKKLINAFINFVKIYYFNKRLVKCRKKTLCHTRMHCSVVWTLNLRLTDSHVQKFTKQLTLRLSVRFIS